MKPYEIKEKLDEYIIGQETVKKMMAVEFYQKSLENAHLFMNTNLLLCGPTGSGKTFIVQTVAKITGLPYHVIDATSLTQEGFKGLSVSESIQSIFHRFGQSEAERAIVFIDEIDKLAVVDDVGSRIATLGVQQELLKIIEGTEIEIRPKEGTPKMVSTKNMTFIFGGAFVGIEEIVEERLTNNPQSPKNVQPQDLIEFGLIPEFVGRIPSIATLSRLTTDELLHVIYNSKKSIFKEYQSLYSLYNIELELEEPAAYQLASEAYDLNTGVRGLNQKLGQLLRSIQYDILLRKELPSKLIITKETVETGEPVLIGSQSWDEKTHDAQSSKVKSLPKSHFMSNDEHFNVLNSINFSEKEFSEIEMIAKGVALSADFSLENFIYVLDKKTAFDTTDIDILNKVLTRILKLSKLAESSLSTLFKNPQFFMEKSITFLDKLAQSHLKEKPNYKKQTFTKEYEHIYFYLAYLIHISQEAEELSKQETA